jgi:hypothetical protein
MKKEKKKYYEVDFTIWDKEDPGRYPKIQSGAVREFQGKLTGEEYNKLCNFIELILKNKRRRK